MIDTLSVIVPSFSSILALGGIFFVLLYAYAASGAADAVHLKCDPLLQERMNQLEIPSWKALAEKSGLTVLQLRLARQGAIAELKLSQLIQLATALHWKLEELLHNFAAVSSAITEKIEPSFTPTQIQEEFLLASAHQEEELRQQCLRLRDELQQQKSQLRADFREATFEQLQPLLTNYPSARQMAEAKPSLPAKNLSALFTPLDNLLESWGIEPIGFAWEQVAYNPQLHQADTDSIAEGELVYIRFVGYRAQERILCPAKVSRTLPGGLKN